jgi:Mce-associated membrane protein
MTAAERAPLASSRRRTAWLAGWLLLAAAATFAAWAGLSYASAAFSGTLAAGRARDAAVQAGTREIADLNTVDDKRIAAWQARWLADTSGAEHARIASTDPAAMAQIEKVKTSSSATVTALAVTSVEGGSARLIATVRVLETAASGATDTIVNRYVAALTLTPAGWKISSLTPG